MNTRNSMHALAAALLLATGIATAAPGAAGQRLNEEIQAALLRLLQSGAVDPAELGSLTVSAAPSQRAEFGAVVDLRPDADSAGVPVLAVTPGGNAAGLGVRAGDRIVAVDGVPLKGGAAAPAEVLRRQLESGAPRLSLTVLREGEMRVLNGPVQSWALPGYRLELEAAVASASLAASAPDSAGCGRISLVGMPPRTENVFPAELIFIDGESPKPYGGPAYRLPAGRHVLTVDEQIDPRRLSMQIALDKQRRQQPREGYKTLELVVEPNTTYRLGSRYFPDLQDRGLENEYWEPVIYAEAHEACR
jgi:hypothetical protein